MRSFNMVESTRRRFISAARRLARGMLLFSMVGSVAACIGSTTRQPLSVSISMPQTTFTANADGSSVYTTVTATPSQAVTKVELSRDGYEPFLTDATAPYDFTWCVTCFGPDEPLPRTVTLHATAYASDGTVVEETAVVTVNPSPAPIPAFPGAEGFGALSKGGRGGRVIEVTNLNDSGPGSFRDAVTQTGPRIVVFRVGGTIDLRSDVSVSGPERSYLTIAGHTAPEGGIQLRYEGLRFEDGVHDVVVRYIRHRVGFIRPDPSNQSAYQGLVLYSPNADRPVYNVIIDHCSVGWQQDDNGSWDYVRDVTYQWNIFAEANSLPGPMEGGTDGHGFLMGSETGAGNRMDTHSFHHNYIVNNFSRNPRFSGDGSFEMVNNLIYNHGSLGAELETPRGDTKINLIGNHWKAGPDSLSTRYELITTLNDGALYVSDNIGPHRPSSSMDEWDIVGHCDWSTGSGCDIQAPSSWRALTPWPVSSVPVTTVPANQVASTILPTVGASLPIRDALDQKVVDDYHNGTGRLGGDNNWPVLANGTPPADTDHDGMPDTWETSKGLNPNNAADGAVFTSSGYTNLENYLNELAAR